MENKLLIPSAIIVAGVIVAGAIIFIKTPVSPSVPSGQPQQVSGNVPAFSNSADILKIRNGDFVLGSPTAKVQIIEYGDFQCPFCGRFFKTVESQIIDNYVKSGKASFVWRDFAFLDSAAGISHGESHLASEAARCAGEQGRFWEYHDYLFNHQSGENQGTFVADNLKKFASTLGLNFSAFNACLDSGKYKKAVEDSTSEGGVVGVNGTPTSFVNGKVVSGAVPYETMKQAIDAALK